MRILIVIGLLVLAGCGGGSSARTTYKPIYNAESGREVWVDEISRPRNREPRRNQSDVYMNYETGETYYSLDPYGNMYMDSEGELYQSY